MAEGGKQVCMGSLRMGNTSFF